MSDEREAYRRFHDLPRTQTQEDDDAALGRAIREAFGDGVTRETVRAIREVVNAAQIAVTAPAFAGVSDEDVMLERAVEALPRLRQEAQQCDS